MGDIEGQRLFYLYTVEVEKQLKEKQLLTITRSPLPANGKSVMDEPPSRQVNRKWLEIVERHHSSEANARVSARRTCMMLRQLPREVQVEYANDPILLEGWAKGYKVKMEHLGLYIQLVQEKMLGAANTNRG